MFCIQSNTLANLFKAKFGTRGFYTVTTIVFSCVHSVINSSQLPFEKFKTGWAAISELLCSIHLLPDNS